MTKIEVIYYVVRGALAGDPIAQEVLRIIIVANLSIIGNTVLVAGVGIYKLMERRRQRLRLQWLYTMKRKRIYDPHTFQR